MASGRLERIFEPSHIRRGRLSTVPSWYVVTPSGERWRFYRKKDATAFMDADCQCVSHKVRLVGACRACGGHWVST